MKAIGNSHSYLFQWDRPYLPILIFGIGIGLVAAMYSHGGLSAVYPFSFAGLVGYFLIVYVIITFGTVDYQDNAHELLSRMIRIAKKSIKIFSGNISSAVYLRKAGEKTLVELLAEKAEKGIQVDIVTQYEPDQITIEALQGVIGRGDVKKVGRNLRLFQLQTGAVDTSMEHFMVVDNLWVRVEKVHGLQKLPHKSRSVRFSLYLHSILNREFNSLLEKADARSFLRA